MDGEALDVVAVECTAVLCEYWVVLVIALPDNDDVIPCSSSTGKSCGKTFWRLINRTKELSPATARWNGWLGNHWMVRMPSGQHPAKGGGGVASGVVVPS